MDPASISAISFPCQVRNVKHVFYVWYQKNNKNKRHVLQFASYTLLSFWAPSIAEAE